MDPVGVGYHPDTNWRQRVWGKVVEATPDWPERDDWRPPDCGPPPAGKQSERRWRWPVHTLRHVCATYQLNVLGLDPDDVAKFFGHRSGVQVSGDVRAGPRQPLRPSRHRQPGCRRPSDPSV